MSQKIRVPKQERSMQKKEKLTTTALALFCENGYHKVTTNQIAKTAGLSIGTLYEYFENKESILLEILEQYFDEIADMNAFGTMFLSLRDSADPVAWFQKLLISQVNSHKKSKDFNAELQSLYFSMPMVREICDRQKNRLHQAVVLGLENIRNSLAITDIEAGAYLLIDMTECIVERIVFYRHDCSEEQIILEGACALTRYLLPI